MTKTNTKTNKLPNSRAAANKWLARNGWRGCRMVCANGLWTVEYYTAGNTGGQYRTTPHFTIAEALQELVESHEAYLAEEAKIDPYPVVSDEEWDAMYGVAE